MAAGGYTCSSPAVGFRILPAVYREIKNNRSEYDDKLEIICILNVYVQIIGNLLSPTSAALVVYSIIIVDFFSSSAIRPNDSLRESSFHCKIYHFTDCAKINI